MGLPLQRIRGKKGMRANVSRPACIETPLRSLPGADTHQPLIQLWLMSSVWRVSKLASAAFFLLSDEAGF